MVSHYPRARTGTTRMAAHHAAFPLLTRLTLIYGVTLLVWNILKEQQGSTVGYLRITVYYLVVYRINYHIHGEPLNCKKAYETL